MCPIKILPIEIIRELDAYTIAHEPINSKDLMERAAFACYTWINGTIDSLQSFKIFCGMGNNGGDGLILARLLHDDGHTVEVFYVKHTQEATPENRINFAKIANIDDLIITEVFENDATIELSDDDIVVDALLGSGINKPVTGCLARIIEQINVFKGIIISIDIPSGLFENWQKAVSEKVSIVNADYTLSFQVPKLDFFIPENDVYVGKWVLLDIGLSYEFIENSETSHYLTQSVDLLLMYKPRKRFAHKGTYGHGLLVAGSSGKIGASVLCASAAIRSGAGLITTHIPSCGIVPMHTAVPEVMIDHDTEDEYIKDLPSDLSKYAAIAVGPGLGMMEESQKMLKLLIQESKVPLIIDADGLNILAENKTWLSFIPKNSILTPHVKEFERLTTSVNSHYERLEILTAFSARYHIYVILKGAYSAIATPSGDIFFNPTGNPGMATAGTGDVLTGILLGLKTSGYTSYETCIMGTWLHGKAGNIANKKLGEASLIASDIIKYLPAAFRKIV